MDRCQQLLMRNADVNYINKNGKTPLHIAVENNLDTKMIRFLLEAEANPHIEDRDGLDVCDKVKRGKF